MTSDSTERMVGVKTTGLARALSVTKRKSWLLYPLLLFVMLTGWSLSSPPGSSPDEDFHLVSAWCGLGTREGYCAPGSDPTTRVVPEALLRTPCYAFAPELSGNCDLGSGEMMETYRGNFGNYYPNGFYALMGLFAGPSVAVSVIAMRVVNSAIYAASLAALLFLARPGRRENYMLGAVIPLVPLGVFVVASVNPSGWAVTSATLVWASAVEFFRARERTRRLALGLLCLFGILLGMAARADAAAYAALAIGLAWLCTVKMTRRTLIYGAGVGVVALGALVWSLSLGSASRLGSIEPMNPEQPRSGWLGRLQDLAEFYAGAFGTRGLGWLDTSLRSATWALAGGVFVAAVFWGLRRSGWRKTVSLSLLAIVASAAPIVIATLRYATLKEAMQPRYFLPILVIAAMIAVSEDNDEGPQFHPFQAVLVVLAMGIAHGNALHTNMRRYLTGIDKKWFNLNRDVEWWWSWAPPPMVFFSVAALSFFAALAIFAVAQHRATDEPLREPASLPRRAFIEPNG